MLARGNAESVDTRPRSGFRDPPPGAHFTLPRDECAPRLARIALRDLVESHGWPHSGDAELVVSELIANAVEHGVGRITLTLWLAEGRIHGEVTDAGTGAPASPAGHADDSIGGRGLMIVGALCDRWGSAEKTSRVWFEIAVA
jgi:anti-sigma regulatory factor (Ser/Thr protein kinase)